VASSLYLADGLLLVVVIGKNSGRSEGGVPCQKKTGWKPILHYALDGSAVVRETGAQTVS
jgi:hypothetical protein